MAFFRKRDSWLSGGSKDGNNGAFFFFYRNLAWVDSLKIFEKVRKDDS